jgi:hypothetical protein
MAFDFFQNCLIAQFHSIPFYNVSGRRKGHLKRRGTQRPLGKEAKNGKRGKKAKKEGGKENQSIGKGTMRFHFFLFDSNLRAFEGG